MTSNNAWRDDFDRLMSQWMAADARVHEPEHLLDAVLEQTRATPRTPSWLLPERWIPVQLTMPLRAAPRLAPVLLIIALVLAAIVAIAVVGSQHRVPDPFGLAGNGRVAYLSDGQIYAANPDGSDPVQLTFGSRSAATPVWSRDGTKVAYKLISPQSPASDPTLYGDLVVADADGSNPITIARNGKSMSPATWSPDGRWLVYSLVVGKADQIFVAAADGSRPPDRVGDPDTVNWAPLFSPDGTKILYFVRSDHVAVMDRDGSGGHMLNTTSFTEIHSAMWHPDGRRVVVAAATEEADDLWFLDVDGKSERHLRLPERAEVGPSWSPDGQRLVYLTSTDGQVFRLYVAAADGTDERMLPGAYSEFNPSWSPDGKRIGVVNDLGSIARVYLIDPDGRADAIEIDSVLPAASVVADRATQVMWQRVAP